MWDIMIIITGMPGSGKDEFIKVARSMGWKDYHMGDTVRKYARQENVENTDKAIGAFASQERKAHGMGIWAERVILEIREDRKVIIDGLRNIEEFDAFRKAFPALVMVAIHTDREERLKRIMKRHRSDDVKDLGELIGRDERELSWGIGNAISLSHYMIVNDSTLEEFKENARKLLLRIEKENPAYLADM
jgi:dephospho-CoA kinase